jgi:ABC-type uncharacterized transport system ATPase subunit
MSQSYTISIKRATFWKVVVPVAAGLLAAGSIGGVFVVDRLVMPHMVGVNKGIVDVPDIVGLPHEDARQKLFDIGLVCRVKEEEFCDTVDVGSVVRQFVDPGSQVKRGRRIDEALELIRITDHQHRIIGHLSKGYRQRVGLADTLVHDPEVLILDEPTVGLDPNQVREVRELVKDLAQERTVLFSTHVIPWVEAVCKRVIVIDRGKIVADGDISQLETDWEGGLEDAFKGLTVGDAVESAAEEGVES